MATYLFVLFLNILFVFIPSKQMIWDLILYLKELMGNEYIVLDKKKLTD